MSAFLDSFTVHSLTGFMSAVAIPIVAIICGISFAAYSMYLKVRRQRETLQIYHAERMAAIEKGIELPPLPPELLHDGHQGDYRREHRRWRRNSGLTLVFVGIAVTVAMWQSDAGDHDFWWGLVIVAWGLGKVVSEFLERRADQSQPGNGPMPPDTTVNR